MDKTQFLKKAALSPVDVKGLGQVFVKALSWNERLECEQLAAANRDNAALYMIAACLCDESGVRMFSYDELNELGQADSRVLMRILDASRTANNWTDNDVQELEKNC